MAQAHHTIIIAADNMMNHLTVKKRGFTLIEMMLVLVIMSAILVAIIGYTQQKTDSMRRDRMVLQIQQIENAAIAYYLANSSWPLTVAALQSSGFLPKPGTAGAAIINPYGNAYVVKGDANTGNLAVCSTVTTGSAAQSTSTSQVISGRVPMGYISNVAASSCSPVMAAATSCSAADCTLVSVINVPGQNLNNARSVNFTGLYRHGGCVPVPICPGTMTPSIIAVPVSVSGVADSGSSTMSYPINSFTAFAKGPSAVGGDVVKCNSASTTASTPPVCTSITPASPSGKYWRVCLQVVTPKGDISGTNPDFGKYVSILGITRCVPTNEPAGSAFTAYQRES